MTTRPGGDVNLDRGCCWSGGVTLFWSLLALLGSATVSAASLPCPETLREAVPPAAADAVRESRDRLPMHRWTAHNHRDWLRAVWPEGTPADVRAWVQARTAFDAALDRDRQRLEAVRAAGLGSEAALERFAALGGDEDALVERFAAGCQGRPAAGWRAAEGELALDELTEAFAALAAARAAVAPETGAARALLAADQADAAYQLAYQRGARARVAAWAGAEDVDPSAVLKVGPVVEALEDAEPSVAMTYLRAWALMAAPSDHRDALLGAEALAEAAEAGTDPFARRARYGLYNHLVDAGRGPAAAAVLQAALGTGGGTFFPEAALVRAEQLFEQGQPGTIRLLDHVLASDEARRDDKLREQATALQARSLLFQFARRDDGVSARAALEARQSLDPDATWVVALGHEMADAALGIGARRIASELFDWLCEVEPDAAEHPLWRYTALTLADEADTIERWDALVGPYAPGSAWARANPDPSSAGLALNMAAAARERQALLAHRQADETPSEQAWSDALIRYADLARQYPEYYDEQGVIAFHARAWLDAGEPRRAAQLVRRRHVVPQSVSCEAWAVDLEIAARTPRRLHPPEERLQAAADGLGERCANSSRDAAYVWRLAEVAARRTRPSLDWSTLVRFVWPRLSQLDQAMLRAPAMLDKASRRHPESVYATCEALEPASDVWSVCDRVRGSLRRSGVIEDDRAATRREGAF